MPNRPRRGRIASAKRSIWYAALFTSLLFALSGFRTVLVRSGPYRVDRGWCDRSKRAPITDAKVAIRQLDTDAVPRIMISDVESHRVTQLTFGKYSIKIDSSCFEQSVITLAIDQVSQIDAKLRYEPPEGHPLPGTLQASASRRCLQCLQSSQPSPSPVAERLQSSHHGICCEIQLARKTPTAEDATAPERKLASGRRTSLFLPPIPAAMSKSIADGNGQAVVIPFRLRGEVDPWLTTLDVIF
jgi:hypothetical protein